MYRILRPQCLILAGWICSRLEVDGDVRWWRMQSNKALLEPWWPRQKASFDQVLNPSDMPLINAIAAQPGRLMKSSWTGSEVCSGLPLSAVETIEAERTRMQFILLQLTLQELTHYQMPQNHHTFPARNRCVSPTSFLPQSRSEPRPIPASVTLTRI